MDALTFTVAGMAPQPQGSKRHLGKGVMVESCKNVKPWRYLVQQAAVSTGHPTITTGVSVSVVFLFQRPKGHYRSGKNAHVLRDAAPRWHTVKPDGSKLLRSTEDALVDAGLLRDDSLICCATFQKRYCVGQERPGALITLIPLA
jgi:Holliday junction resolvase RusA-like endonuclease